MNDAMGVRLETGRQAMVLNDMMELFKEMGRWDGKHPIDSMGIDIPLAVLSEKP